MANYYSTDYKKILDEEIKNLDATKKKQQDKINKIYDSQTNILNDQYNKAVDDATIAYEDEYEKNAVQKLINEKQIAERNANLGLTDSGLNRTQQTAAELSYANGKRNISLAKQNALDTLSQNLAASLSSIEQGRISNLAEVDTAIESQAHQNALNRYNANVDANVKIYEAGQAVNSNNINKNILNSKNSTLGNLHGSFESNGITSIHNADGSTTYTDTITGVSVTMDEGVNPYTGANNLIENTQTAKAVLKYGAFSNGYQPMGIIGYGVVTNTGDETMVDGRRQSIWKTPDGTEWIWRGIKNCYIKFKDVD